MQIMEVISYSANVRKSLRQDFFEDLRGQQKVRESVTARTFSHFSDSFSPRKSAIGLSRKGILAQIYSPLYRVTRDIVYTIYTMHTLPYNV